MKPSIHSKWAAWALGASIVLLAGCQTTPSHWRDGVRENINTNLEQGKAATKNGAVPNDVSKALLPPIDITLPDGKAVPLESRFNLAVSAAPARQVFMGLVEGTPYDVVVHPSVGGTVTLNLKDVTVPDAFKALREAYGYEYRREGNRFFVLGRELQMRLFNVNYLNLIRKGKSDTRVSGGGIGQRSSGTGSSNNSSSTSGQSGFSSVELETQSQMDFWKDIQSTLTALVGSEGGRKVIVNSQTGVVAVRAMPDELRMVEEYLGTTHSTVNRQVVLEAKILEVELNDGFQTGINWAKVSSHYTIGQTGGGSSLTGSGVPGPSDIIGNSGILNPTAGVFSPISNTDASAFGGIFSVAAKFNNFAAFVELLKSQGEVQVLSSPRVSAVNNQKAVIKVGADEFFVTGISSTTSAVTGGTATSPTVELASFFSGIVLDVTPQIDEANNIILHIHPAISAVTEKTKSFTALGTGFTLPLAFSTVQESDNVVRAGSGQIIVIGGLMKEGTTDENSSVPFLGDIPVVGYLFKHKKVTRIKKELVILLKPTVIKVDQDWSDAIGESQERVKKIRIGS
jgi:MSHA biogenesis protein MshL